MQKKKVVVFDFDGVLIITPRAVINQFQEIEEELAEEIEENRRLKVHSLEDFVERWGLSLRDLFGAWYEQDTIDWIVQKFFDEKKKNHIAAPNLVPTLNELEKMGFGLCVISNHDKDYLDESLDGAGIDTGRFSFILGSGADDIQKPDWRVFSKLPKETEKVIYVGDTDIDYNTVKNAQKADEFSSKITFVGISQAKDDEMRRLFTRKLKEAGVPKSKILSSLDKLPEYLKRDA